MLSEALIDERLVQRKVMKDLRWLILLALTASVLTSAVATIHWPLVGDAPLLHYVAFLIDHGKVPYRDIIEMDLPGTYALEWTAIHVLGPGSLAWRFFDFGLLAAALAAMVAITWPEDWLQGFFAGTLFALLHFRDGPTHTGQRDLMMAVAALIAVAALFYAARRDATPRQHLWLAAAFGLFAGAAATIKPSGILFGLALIPLFWLRIRKLHQPSAATITVAIAGFALSLLAVAAYLIHHQALGPFFTILRGIGAYHASLGRPSLPTLLVGSFPNVLLAVALPAVPLFVVAKPWKSWHGQVLLACALIGVASYVIQGKGFPYHRYPTEAFLLLLCARLLFAALRVPGWQRIVAIGGLLFGALFLAPASAKISTQYDWRDQEFQQMLTADLMRLGGPTQGVAALSGHVQCFEMAAECHNTLYNLHLVEATGFMYDCYMFQSKQTPVSLQYRQEFRAAIAANPPTVYILTDEDCFTRDRTFTKTERWPEFQHVLDTQYTVVAQRTPPHLLGWWRKPAVPFSYRLYVRRQP